MEEEDRDGEKKIKLRKSEILSNVEARERIRGKIVCIIHNVPSIFNGFDEEDGLSDNMLVLIKENGKYKIIVIPNEDFKNAILLENIPQEVIGWIKKEEMAQSELLWTLWGGGVASSSTKKKLSNNNMYV